MRVIGLVGGVASGKSAVAKVLGELGAVILDADRAGHEVRCDPEVIRAAAQRWGRAVLGADGQLDRAQVAKIVFAPASGATERKFLEQLTHSRIAKLLAKQAADAAAAGKRIAVLDAPVLLEAGWERFCDTILFVESMKDTRLERARQRGWDNHEFEAREAAQLSVEEKRRRAQAVIDNSGSAEETRAQVERFWRTHCG